MANYIIHGVDDGGILHNQTINENLVLFVLGVRLFERFLCVSFGSVRLRGL